MPTIEEYKKKLINYYDENGKLIQYPSKKPMREIVLKKIADEFEINMDYNEKEVNEIIKGQISFSDVELIRRELFQAKYIGRLKDGSKYWKEPTQKDRMMAGQLYYAGDSELVDMVHRKDELLYEFNRHDITLEQRKQAMNNLLGSIGENSYIHEPFYCDYGCNIHIGKHFYANYDCVFLDVNKITIGDNAFFAPKVCLFTAGHPIDKDIRNEELEYGYPITIGNDVWIGGNVVVNPGVTIGDNVVIGSGSVVTKDIPSNVIAAGNPCRVIRNITDEDKKYWKEQKELR